MDEQNEREKQEQAVRRELASARRFRKASTEQVAALESKLLDARIERERLGGEWAMDLLAGWQERRRERAAVVPVMVAA